MKAIVYEGPNKLNYTDVPDVSPVKGEVKLRIKACGICGSDVAGYQGLTGRRLEPMIMGHEFCGEVVECAEGVTKIKQGDLVAVYPVNFCGECEMCKKGDVHLCLNKRSYGVLAENGAFAEYLCVPEKCCFKVAPGVSPVIGSLMEPLAVAYRGVGHLGDLTGKSVFLAGTGTIGLLAMVCAKIKGAAKIFVSDMDDDRLQVAKDLGADVLINPSKEDPKEVVLKNTNNMGVDCAIEAVGIAPTVQQVMSVLRLNGKAVWIGNNRKMIEMNMQEVVTRELEIYGSFLYGYQEFKEVVDLLNNGKLNVEPLISKVVRLDEAITYFDKLKNHEDNLIKVVVVDE
ncbi:MAG: alcohol dehydrogenase catalytic domain-containing protein [Lachnospiraceae bacterium]|nr:alcohol dehydrogenase catalytic domain-containing protein [Lachnospiraceae bacterium]MBR4993348.1 alcohol dehydrogenase catalytic domain-containing protein [Lachnospiraceae bacterium]